MNSARPNARFRKYGSGFITRLRSCAHSNLVSNIARQGLISIEDPFRISGMNLTTYQSSTKKSGEPYNSRKALKWIVRIPGHSNISRHSFRVWGLGFPNPLDRRWLSNPLLLGH